ncbi:MAG TPA: cob(I)yrinic acid a,c-diamide adenosyltransferase [Flavobacteriales bacterium]|nr:cob(I)yrinic acid a,c-diamide adenosyltransferase [Flavobacteriales bacterium]
MRIYTRTGDKGETGLLGGKRVPKDDLRIETYGTVDELNSHLGALRDLAAPHHHDLLISIQEQLFSIGSRLASQNEEEAGKFKVPSITEEHILALERAMDRMDAELEPMRNFILPGGHIASSQAHVCRTVCRRAERRAVQLARENELDPVLIRYLNRLSDLLFVMARHLAKLNGVPDTPWVPKS